MATERPAKAKRILIVEDEPMIRMLLEDMLSELGYTVAAEAAGIEEALEATKNADFDLAILDADLKGQPALPVAQALVYPRHAVRFCHGLWRGARALSGPADARVWGHLGRGKGCGVSLRPFAFQRGPRHSSSTCLSRPTTIDKTGIQRPVAARNQALTTPGSLAPAKSCRRP